MRVGWGYDVHRLVAGRPLILGGVTVPYNKGLLGHSDADVLAHAVIDALLGAAGLNDIGSHFPDSDERFAGISGMYLLDETNKLIGAAGFKIINIDATIIAEKPKLAEYKEQMGRNIAGALCICKKNVNIKATTEEGLGFTGEGLGIAAQAVCLLELDG